MPWIQITLEADQSLTEQIEQILLAAGALSVTLKDAKDNPVLEPASLLAMHTKPGGIIILSGILETQVKIIGNTYSRWFKLNPPVLYDEWARMCGKKLLA